MAYGRCSNPRCGDHISPDWHIQLCASCRWLGGRALAAGAFLGGVIVAIWEAWR